MESIHSYPIVGDLSAEAQKLIHPYLTVNEYAENEIILEQGQQETEFHIIISGTLDVFVKKEELRRPSKTHITTLTAGQFFGEMSCLTEQEVSASIQALEQVKTISLKKEGMLCLMDESPAFRNLMIKEMVQRLSSSNIRVVEEHSKSLAALRQLKLEQQAKFGDFVGNSAFNLKINKEISKLALTDEPLCILGEKGVGRTHLAWEIHRQSPRSALPILTIEATKFNEFDWLDKRQTAANGMILIKQAECLEPQKLQLVLNSPAKVRIVFIADTDFEVPSQAIHCIKVPPLRERKSDIPIFIKQFIKEANFPNPDEICSQEALNLIQNFPFLHANVLELKNLVLDALIRSHGKKIQSKHIRFGSPKKLGQRPSIGLALGSGSVKGIAHVGVLKALEEAEIPIDLIAGTSAGALVGSIYAGGLPIHTFEEVIPSLRWRDLVRFTLPKKGIVNNQLMAQYIEKFIGKLSFKDLKIPFAAVASDATSGEAVILNTGRVSHAVCASTAIPGVMHPVDFNNRTLLDGAVAQPVPVALAKSMGADLVIAVDVSTPWQARKAPNNFIGTILNTIDIMSERIVSDELQLADIVLKPWLNNNQLNFKDSNAYIERGYEVTKAAIPQILEKIEQYKQDAQLE